MNKYQNLFDDLDLGMSYQDIANKYNIALGMVKSRISRARKAVRIENAKEQPEAN